MDGAREETSPTTNVGGTGLPSKNTIGLKFFMSGKVSFPLLLKRGFGKSYWSSILLLFGGGIVIFGRSSSASCCSGSIGLSVASFIGTSVTAFTSW